MSHGGRVRVGLFVTCVVDAICPETGKAVVHLLERLGHDVAFPMAQTCCGQLHINSGYRQEALPLVRRFVATFRGFEAVVSPSSSCVGVIRELYPALAREAGDDRLVKEASALGERVFELSEFLVDRLGVTDVGASFPHRVTYQKRIQGAMYGMMAPSSAIPQLLGLWQAGRLKLEEMITTTYRLDDINRGYADMHAGINMRGMISFDQPGTAGANDRARATVGV
jgi:hypothetical protein